MKRPIRNCVGLVIFLVAIAAAFYTQRVRIGDLVGEASAPALPPAVAYKDTVDADPATVLTTVAVDESKTPAPVVSPPASGTNVPENPVSTPAPEPVPASPTPPEATIAASFNLAVPFTSQAPFANWDEMHEETCEEAAIYMVASFFNGVTGKIDPTVAEAELQRLVAIENDTFGYYKDTTADETMILASKAYPSLHVQTMYDLTAENIKAEIASGHPVVVPTAGRMLHNPNFTGDGPPYHMIVIRGYTETQFITNDPGTRRGESYVYDVDTIMAAMHDWNGGDVEGGKKVVIVLYPN